VQLRFLLGPAGSGKTFRCLTEAARALSTSPEGPPLLFLAPKQMTYQLERQLLGNWGLQGYSRLHILSFERLARHIFAQCRKPVPDMLDDEGRTMVLRSLLARRRDMLKLFRASARLTGFAQQLSQTLRELQRNQLTPESLDQLAAKFKDNEALSLKLEDLATMLRDYSRWLQEHELHDADCLLDSAAACLQASAPDRNGTGDPNSQAVETTPSASTLNGGTPNLPNSTPAVRSKARRRDVRSRGQLFLSFANEQPKSLQAAASLGIVQLWVDGFAEWSSQELNILAALLPHCETATLTFCLDKPPAKRASWLSTWSSIQRNFEDCQNRLGSLPGVNLNVETLPRSPEGRFSKSPILAHLERAWSDPEPYPLFDGNASHSRSTPTHPLTHLPTHHPAPTHEALRIAVCTNPEAEATLAAREILRHVRSGSRFRDVAVLVRNLDGYHEPIQRIFSRYDIPFFLDRRESVAHHPLAELTRSALRTVALGWQMEDWFAALKTGLAPAKDEEIDWLENEALARGWRGSAWQKPVIIKNDPDLTMRLADLHARLLPPFQKLEQTFAAQQHRPDGLRVASALRDLWRDLAMENRLQDWSTAELSHTDFRAPASVHSTVWNQMNLWLENVELAFPTERLSVREWLPILEAGLTSLTVGVIPPGLDQVLVGAIDRSRTPDAELALVLGLNESIFPATPQTGGLLTESDRNELEKHQLFLGSNARQQLSRERYYAYIACTRARQRLVLTCAQHDASGSPLNPSPFLDQFKRLFPDLIIESIPRTFDWHDSEHANELIIPLLRAGPLSLKTNQPLAAGITELASLPAIAEVSEALRHIQSAESEESLAPELAARLYGPVLHTSVSRMEQFAACPFKFFVHSGLRAEERKQFELDVKEQGSFQHEALARFHHELRREGKRWRDITPAEARQRVAGICKTLVVDYQDGLLEASEETKFLGRVLTSSLQDFVETLVEWMRQQYEFDPVAVELPFGQDNAPPWQLDLGNGLALALSGRIDRVDLWQPPGTDEALCVVLDYKSSQKSLDPILLANGLQLQLLTYLNVLRHWPGAREKFGPLRLLPAGVFYVNLRGKYGREPNRLNALASVVEARKLAYRHAGRFDVRALRWLDARREATKGDQFNYRLTTGGRVTKNSRDAMNASEFIALLDSVQAHLLQMARKAFSGIAVVAPYRKASTTACDQCDYQAICRIDPWTHTFRVLRKPNEE
jgi:ATP-dependent helicase/nuclease subunit B